MKRQTLNKYWNIISAISIFDANMYAKEDLCIHVAILQYLFVNKHKDHYRMDLVSKYKLSEIRTLYTIEKYMDASHLLKLAINFLFR